LITFGGNLTELATDHDQQIGRGDQIIGNARIAAEQSGGQGMSAGDPALAGDRMRDRDILRLGEEGKRVVRVGQMDAATDQDERALRTRDQRRGGVNGAPVRPGWPRRRAHA